MKKILLTTLSAVILLSACKKTEPTACATANKTKITPGESVAFTSCSKDGVKYAWDFGDGTTAEGETATHKFDLTGTYLVQLRAFSKKNKLSDKYSLVITVNPTTPPKERYLKKIVIRGVAETKPSGAAWDAAIPLITPSSTADVILKLKLASGGFELATPEETNLITANCPVSFNYEPNNYKIINEDWVLDMLDNDIGSTDLMTTFTKNLYTATLATGGIITFSDANGNIVDLYIIEK